MDKEKFTGTATITRLDIENKLEKALADLKETLGEKKFKRRIKKAVKVLGKNLSVKKTKKVVKIKKLKDKKA